MSQPYIGEIRMFAGNFAPANWATCDGQLLLIANYSTLFQLIGTTYGGDGQTTFALPNLAARVPVHTGSNGTSTYPLGNTAGVTSVILNQNQIPAHSHPIAADSGNATTSSPANAFFANSTPKLLYTVPNGPNTPHPPTLRALNSGMVQSAGGNQPHENMQPYLTLSFIISLFGNYPAP
jgi:microcystin-dependent protein